MVVGYYPPGFLPALHPLARHFTICDHWFSSVPGPTWTNRFFLLSGTSAGHVAMPGDDSKQFNYWTDWFVQRQDTIFDRLSEKGIHWKSYFHDIPQSSMLVHQWSPHNAARYFYIDEFFRDAAGRVDDFPQFAFIEPDYGGTNQNDDHPPLDVMKGERLIARVYNAIRANPASGSRPCLSCCSTSMAVSMTTCRRRRQCRPTVTPRSTRLTGLACGCRPC